MRSLKSVVSLALILLCATTAWSLPVRRGTAADAAQGFYAAWKTHNRAAAGKVASRAAVAQLFKNKWTGPDWYWQGCETTKRRTTCAYSYDGGAAIFTMKAQGKGYVVTAISYIID